MSEHGIDSWRLANAVLRLNSATERLGTAKEDGEDVAITDLAELLCIEARCAIGSCMDAVREAPPAEHLTILQKFRPSLESAVSASKGTRYEHRLVQRQKDIDDFQRGLSAD